MKRIFVFDLDGTLTNTLPTITYYVNFALREVGLGHLGEIPPERICRYVGDGAVLLCHRALAHFGLDDPEHADLYEAYWQAYNRAYDARPLYLTRPYEGMAELIDALSRRQIACAVLSNKPQTAVTAVVQHFFADRFAPVWGARPGIPLKPAPDALLALLSEQGIDPRDAVMVGDTKVDIETGRNAGVDTVGVLWGFRDRAELVQAGATFIAQKPQDILRQLL